MTPQHVEQEQSLQHSSIEGKSIKTREYSDHDDNDESNSVADGKVGSREKDVMNASKYCFFFVLFVAAAIITAATYHFTKESQLRDYEHAFRIYAKEITYLANTNVFNTFGMVGSMGISMTTYVLDNADVSWPFVTIPHFEARGEEARKVSKAELIVLAPLVYSNEKAAWENYTAHQQAWIADGLDYLGLNDTEPGSISTEIVSSDTTAEFYVPLWEMSPPPTNASVVNVDLMANARMRDVVDAAMAERHGMLSPVSGPESPLVPAVPIDNRPRSYLVEPVFEDFTSGASVVGFVIALFPWAYYFENVLPEGTNGVIAHVNDGCGTDFTYRIDGPNAIFVGMGDLHDRNYDSLRETSEFAVLDQVRTTAAVGETDQSRIDSNTMKSPNGCVYSVTLYPSHEFESMYKTNGPVFFTCLIVLVFLATVVLFTLYDWFNRKRQNKAMSAAAKSKAIVSSLFPKDVQKRIMEEAEEAAFASQKKSTKAKLQSNKYPMEEGAFDDLVEKDLGDDKSDGNPFKNKPIADLYLSVTVMFADIVGFTAWSSMREPSQVFTLLETLYHAFDVIAKRRRVFKVETVGDCYVAVCGLPDECKDHAVVMSRFARECVLEFGVLTKDLETILGPDTGDLGIRIGLHSGQVTAGVLRGERARFQLFGDTMNTTARIEHTGERNKIHLSQETADLLAISGKEHWVEARDNKVVVKDKGEMKTYWLVQTQAHPASKNGENTQKKGGIQSPAASKNFHGFSVSEAMAGQQKITDKHRRLVNWTSDVLGRMLKEIIASREAARVIPDPKSKMMKLEQSKLGKGQKLVLEEMKEIIELPHFDAVAAEQRVAPENAELADCVKEQLHSYVQHIAAMYRNNPFHNFEHASHVTMSVVKLLSRIVAPSHLTNDKSNASSLHDHTYGITSDPLTQFAVVLSALIHDVDHPGVPNAQLVKEGAHLAGAYKNKSVAEQNSVDLAWNLLMGNQFRDLRHVIYTNEAEFNRFRQLIVNSVMATDIMDKDLGALRKGRWAKAFTDSPSGPDEHDVNRKATIVIEHLIQASDVAHTMQHWHIYRKWNTRFFHEMHIAYKEGRSATDPALNWYDGEIGFFDFYIIPLAMKLRSCGVFGVSSDEYLNYAQQNREEWQLKGKEIVAEMVEEVNRKEGLYA